MARLLRAATGITGLDPHAARAQVYAQVRYADPEDLALFDDLVGIADPDVKLPKIDPDAWRRRLTALVNAVSVARDGLALCVIEDAHWIDEVSESMLADLTVISQTPASRTLASRSPATGDEVAALHSAGVHCCTDTGHRSAAEQADDCGVGERNRPWFIRLRAQRLCLRRHRYQGGSQRGPVGEGHGL